MSTGAKDTACIDFSQHAWRPEICVNCQRPRNEHTGAAEGTVPSATIVIDQSQTQESVATPEETQRVPVPSKRAATLPRKSKTAATKQTSHRVKDDNGTSLGSQQTQTEIKEKDLKRSKSHSEQASEPQQQNQSQRGSTIILRKNHGGHSGKKAKSDPPKGILSRKRSGERKKTEDKSSSRVAFFDTSPHVIGYDGGVDNLFDDEEDNTVNDDGDPLNSLSNGSFSLTDEEKSFALLSLENTVFNSEAENLLHDDPHSVSSRRHSSREFEDVSPDALFFSRHFQNLKDCDATTRHGTFPLRNPSSTTKLALDSVFSEDLESSRLSGFDLDKAKGNDPSKVATNGEVKARLVMTDSSTQAYKVVNIVDDVSKPHDSDNVSDNSGNSSGRGHASSSESSSPTRVKVRGRSRPTTIRVSTVEPQASPRRDSSTEQGESDVDSLNDSTTAAGLHVLALLNDVLSNYGDNESSTDDPGESKDEDCSKKSNNFEARMASVAANLDLSKQQRAKRPAPRPPSSPPPEPSVSPKKKTQTQPEPVFKMVPMGKAIMAVPPQHDLPKSCTSPHGQGLPSFDDLPETDGDRANGDGGRSKKGITSFFKNILRRGRDSADSPECSNPEVQFAVRSEVGSSSAPTLTDGTGDTARRGSESAGKFRVLPPGGAVGVKGGSASTGDLPASQRSGDSDGSGDSVSSQGAVTTPSSQTKSKGLSSPKQMLKRPAAKLSPPTQHRNVSQSKAEVSSTPTRTKPSLAARKSDEKDGAEAPSHPAPVRRRAKSPKRIPPPAPPARQAGGGKAEEGMSAELTRELELRLKSPSPSSFSAPAVAAKPTVQPPKPAPQSLKPDSQSKLDVRKSMTVPPPSPPTSKTHQVSRSPPPSPTPEESDSQPGSPTDDTTSNSDDSPRFIEKIELPTAAPGKKGILGKLNMNRKSRAPAPPTAVKRAHSTGDSEKRGKRINPADISGPVLVPEVTTTAVMERRNTFSIGDDASSNAASSAIEKGYDDLDMPILSPLGSLENLYEAILPKDGGASKFPYYDPPDKTTRSLCPNVPAIGYLEPVGSASSTVTTEGSCDPSKGSEVVESSPAKSTTKESGARREIVTKLPSGKSNRKSKVHPGAPTGEGENFVEPELTEERRQLIASQPIYEEIPPVASDLWEDRVNDDDMDSKSLVSQMTQMSDMSHGSPVHTMDSSHKASVVQSATLPHPRRKPSTDSTSKSVKRRGSASHDETLSVSAAVTAPSHAMTSSMMSALPATTSSSAATTLASPFMTASMTSSLLWGQSSPSQPVDSKGELLPLPPIPQMAPRSVSKETVSSESDTHSSSGTLSRPRPVPRRRPKRPDTAGSDQYVSMNRPNTQVTLGEGKLRDTFSRLTALNFQTLHDVYVQCERLLTLEKISLVAPSHLKWADFDIYGQALHASGRCVVYNAKLRSNNLACQIMVLHSRPAAEMTLSTHPSLLRPAAIFADNVPFSFLTPDFIKTSQLLQNSVYDSCLARCFLAVGLFDIADSLSSHLTLMRETLTHDPATYLHVLLMTTLQLLSAMSHCLDRGFTVTETDLGDVFHVAREDLRGKVVAFLPHQRAPDVPQGEAMCGFLDKLLQDATNDYYNHDASVDPNDEESQLLTTVERLRILLEPRRIECLAHLRAVVEYTLWGPRHLGDTIIPSSSSSAALDRSESLESSVECDASSVEQDHCAWLERERAAMVSRFACSVDGQSQGVVLEDFYRLKFMLKSSATSLAECWRRLN
ncbi:hypothetical protein V1264_005730 [Littorina saxatilis]|uniref:Uncharacterized protein n=1 Tax=Littorina saxatilis TaxID=31220 RepID=A0AAN9B064_9CAEN